MQASRQLFRFGTGGRLRCVVSARSWSNLRDRLVPSLSTLEIEYFLE